MLQYCNILIPIYDERWRDPCIWVTIIKRLFTQRSASCISRVRGNKRLVGGCGAGHKRVIIAVQTACSCSPSLCLSDSLRVTELFFDFFPHMFERLYVESSRRRTQDYLSLMPHLVSRTSRQLEGGRGRLMTSITFCLL